MMNSYDTTTIPSDMSDTIPDTLLIGGGDQVVRRGLEPIPAVRVVLVVTDEVANPTLLALCRLCN